MHTQIANHAASILAHDIYPFLPLRIEEYPDQVLLYCEETRLHLRCDDCGKKLVCNGKMNPRRVRDISRDQRELYLILCQRRYRCREHGASVLMPDWLNAKCHTTILFEDHLLQALAMQPTMVSKRAFAREANVSVRLLDRVLSRAIERHKRF